MKAFKYQTIQQWKQAQDDLEQEWRKVQNRDLLKDCWIVDARGEAGSVYLPQPSVPQWVKTIRGESLTHDENRLS
jgi:hypothetical protein